MHATTAPPPASARRVPWLINRQFTLLWVGEAISGLGDIVFTITLSLWIVAGLAHGRAWAPLAVSGVLVAGALPDLLVGPFAGVFVDRWDRRRAMLRMDAARAGLIVLLAVLTGAIALPFARGARPSASWDLAAIYLVIFLAGSCAQFFNPARMAAIGDLVPEAERPRATGLNQATGSLSVIVGPPIAAALYFAVGAGPALALNALSFGVSFLAIRAVRLPHTGAAGSAGGAGSYRRELVEGLRYFAGNRVLTTVLITVVIVMCGAGAINALDIFFLTQNLHAPIHLYGVLNAAAGAGVLIGAILSSVFAQRLGVARTFWISMLILSLLILVYARLTSFGPALAVLFVVGLPNAAVNVTIGALVLNATPRALIGRVTSVLQPVISLASLLSMAVAGYLASVVLRGFHARWLGMNWGAVDTIFTAAGLLGLAGGVYAVANLRRATALDSQGSAQSCL